MTFQQLYYVSEVAKVGSINRAAQALFVSQSTVSTAIKELEHELDCQLFIRTATGITMTASGRQFLNYARSLLDQKKRTEKLFKTTPKKKFSQLQVASQHIAFSASALIDLVHSSMDKDFEFTLKEIAIGRLIEEVSHGQSDLGVIFISDVMMDFVTAMLHDNSLEYHELCKLSPRIRVRQGHPLTQLEQVQKKDLLEFPYLAFYQDSYAAPFEHMTAEQLFSDYKPSKAIYNNDRGTVDDILDHTDAYHFSSGLLSERERSSYVLLKLCDWTWSVHLAWVKREGEGLSLDAQHFIDNFTASIIAHNHVT